MSTRQLFLSGFLACAGLLAVAFYFQYAAYLQPCPLCILQRVAFMVVGGVFLVAAVHGPRGIGPRVYGGLAGLAAVGGAAVAGRHVWLQNLPPEQVPECGPGLGFMFETLPYTQALELIFRGSGECAQTHWTWLGLSMPAWSLAWLAALAALAIFIVFRPRLGR